MAIIIIIVSIWLIHLSRFLHQRKISAYFHAWSHTHTHRNNVSHTCGRCRQTRTSPLYLLLLLLFLLLFLLFPFYFILLQHDTLHYSINSSSSSAAAIASSLSSSYCCFYCKTIRHHRQFCKTRCLCNESLMCLYLNIHVV